MAEIKMIAPFVVQATDKTPSVSFVPDNLHFNISGIATSPQTKEIFLKAGHWLVEYDKQLDLLSQENIIKSLNLVFEFNLMQADDASLEAVKGLMERLEIMNSRFVHIIVRWRYHSSNEKMKSFIQQYIDGYDLFFETVNEMGVPSFFTHPTDTSPKIFFDTPQGVFRISGSSCPEHPEAFYSPIMKWIKTNGSQYMLGKPFDIKMRYFNTSSAKCIMDTLFIVDKLYASEAKGVINWHYSSEDELAEGQEFESNVQNLSFNYIMRTNKE